MTHASQAKTRPSISVCIPAYEMHGLGSGFLKESLDILAAQDFRDFEVVVSDHSKDDAIEKLCGSYGDTLRVTYARNERGRGNLGANFNNAILHAKGKVIKMLMQDDFLLGADSLRRVAEAFDGGKDGWLVTATIRTRDGKEFYGPFYPYWNNRMHRGNNTISSPSVLAFTNTDPLPFDEDVTWNLDCDYYKRLHERYGEPRILDSILVANRIGAHQVSSTRTREDLQDAEYAYMLRKHGERNPGPLMFLRACSRFRDRTKRALKAAYKKARKI
jgi:glycosyltransferase involved in cell wall biosynthesis